jgi:Nucleotidyltransferase of unknown function (DUF6036)
MPSATPADLPDPWRRFLGDVDRALPVRVQLHCLGGFVLAVQHRHSHTTSDVDYIEVVPHDANETLQGIAGRTSSLARKHRLYLQYVGVASLPESYVERLTELLPGTFRNLSLLALDAHDLALSKLAPNHPVDREDIAYLARTVPLRADVLRKRYREELRPIIIGDPEVHDRTLDMWIEAYLQ